MGDIGQWESLILVNDDYISTGQFFSFQSNSECMKSAWSELCIQIQYLEYDAKNKKAISVKKTIRDIEFSTLCCSIFVKIFSRLMALE